MTQPAERPTRARDESPTESAPEAVASVVREHARELPPSPPLRERPSRRPSRSSIAFRMSTLSMPTVPVEGVGRVALVVVLCILGLAALFAIRSLLAPLLLGACVAAMVRPWMTRLRKRIQGPKRAAAAATAGVVLLIALPIALMSIPIIAEARALYTQVQQNGLGSMSTVLNAIVPGESHPRSISEWAHALGPKLAEALPGLLGALSEIAMGIFVFLMTLYYVLVDGESAMRLARRVSPLAHTHLDALVREFEEVGRGVLLSVGITAVVEGGAAGIAYFALGLPSAALLTLLTAIAALVPIGTVLVWGPIAAVLFSQGKTLAGVVIVATGFVVISGIDHFMRPQLTRLAKTRLHPLLVFLGMFGGMASLGGWGLFAGPMLIALGVAALRLYDRDQQARIRQTAALLAASPFDPRVEAAIEAKGTTPSSDASAPDAIASREPVEPGPDASSEQVATHRVA